MTQANHDAVIPPSSITTDSAALSGNESTMGTEPIPALMVPVDCMAAAKVYSTPSASGDHRIARVTVMNGRCASRATVPALSNPTYDVMASSRAKPNAE